MARHCSSLAVGDRFLGGENRNLLFNGFEGSNKEKMGREQKEQVL